VLAPLPSGIAQATARRGIFVTESISNSKPSQTFQKDIAFFSH
jgi:hypothetical protein